MANVGSKPVEILLAEDEDADIDLVREATKKFKICNHLHVVRNGEELLFGSSLMPTPPWLTINCPLPRDLEKILRHHLPLSPANDLLKSFDINIFVVSAG